VKLSHNRNSRLLHYGFHPPETSTPNTFLVLTDRIYFADCAATSTRNERSVQTNVTAIVGMKTITPEYESARDCGVARHIPYPDTCRS